MSSHTIDLSGQRGISLTINDPAKTGLWAPAKAGDDVIAQIGNVREVRLTLSTTGTRVEKREFVTKKQRMENNKAVKDENGNYVYDETPYIGYVLVLPGSVNFFGRASVLDGDEGAYENTPHTSMSARRMKEPHFTESGTLVEDYDLGEWIASQQQEAPAE